MATYSATKEFANRQVKPFVCPKIPKLNWKVTNFYLHDNGFIRYRSLNIQIDFTVCLDNVFSFFRLNGIISEDKSVN
jgi:hypothetical protein